MIYAIAFGVATFFASAECFEWTELIEQHKECMGDTTYQLITQQYQAFKAGIAPKISHPDVKKIAIIEGNEPLVHCAQASNKRIGTLEGDILLQAHTQPEDIDPRSEKYPYVRQGVYDALCRMIQELDILAPYFGYEAKDLEIKLFEGVRDLAMQKKLFDTKLNELMAANPEMSYDQAYEQTCYWVSPYINNTPVHSTGAAIDIALYNKRTQTFCSMGRFNVGGLGAPTFSEDQSLTVEQKNHRLLFLIAATRAGLTNYVYEFWHYSYNDRYALYWVNSGDDSLYSPYDAIA